MVNTDSWATRRFKILKNVEKVMGPLPQHSNTKPLDLQIEETTNFSGVTRLKISYVPEPGDRVPAYLLKPSKLSRKAPAMLCLHQTIPIGKAEPAGLGGNHNLHYALELAQRGYICLTPDYPNFGEYKYDPYINGYTSATMKGIVNHMRAIDLLISLDEVAPDRIGCIGHSLGGHNTIFLGAFDTRVKVMVSSCGFNSFFKYKRGDLTGWSHKGYMPRIESVYEKDPSKLPFDFTDLITSLAPRGFFTNSPLNDDNFELSGVRDCIQAASPVYELLGATNLIVPAHPNAGHEFPQKVREQAYSFIDSILDHSI